MKIIHRIVQSLLGFPKLPGRDYLIEKLPKWFIKPATDEVVVATRFGFQIHLDPLFDRNIENVIYERGVYELGTVSIIQGILQEGDMFIDAGANIGFLSMVAAAKVGPSGCVYSFEPVPSTFSILERNKELNSLKQLELFQHALGSKKEVVQIFTESENRGGASITNKRSDEGIEIAVKPLDELELDKPIKLLKVDVEGYELEVLKGAKKLIMRDKPHLIVEYSQDRNNTEEPHALYHWIKELGIYDVYRLKKGKERKSHLVPVVSKTAGLPQHDNIICMPKLK